MSIHIEQRVAQKGNEWWTWSVWLEGAAKDLDAIKQVTYTLHPTFPTPVVTVTNRQTGFRLNSSGWGEFMIYLKIETQDGRAKVRQHYLRFSESTSKKSQRKSKRSVADETKEPMRPTVFLSGGARDIDAVRAVRSALLEHQVNVVDATDLPLGQQWQDAIGRKIAEAAAAVFVISGRTNLWLNEEIKAAVNAGVPHIVPVLLGENVDLPQGLQDFQAVRVENPLAVEELTNKILGQTLKNQT